MAAKYGANLRNSAGELPAYVWPGGYPIFYVTADHGVLCPPCANGRNGSEANRVDLDPTDPSDKQWRVMAHDVNWEDPDLQCDHCYNRIESAYAENDTEGSK